MGDAPKVACVAIDQQSILLCLWTCVISRQSDLEPKYQKFQGPFVLRVNIVEDDPCSYAVYTEQGSSASQMTAAKVMYVIARPLECAGQAVSAYSQVQMEDAPKLLKIPKSECPDKWIRLPKTQMAKLARAVTKWTRACDRRLARLMAYIYHTNDHRQCCHVSKTQVLLGTSKTRNQPRGESYVSSEVEHSFP